MKKFIYALLAICLFLGVSGTIKAQSKKNLTLNDINIRDPYIMPVEKEGVYYMYC
jgi:hypothetical protein